MSYLLDTLSCIRFLNHPDTGIARQLRRVPRSDVVLCDVVKAELYFAAESGKFWREQLPVLDGFFRVFASLPFDRKSARIYGQVRSDVEKRGLSLGQNDLMIAAVALADELTLVSPNVDGFGAIDGLRVMNWESPTGGAISGGRR